MDIFGAHKWWIIGLVILATVGSAGIAGYRHGLKVKQGEWDAATAEALIQAEAERVALERFAQQVTRDYLTKETTIRRQADELKQKVPNVTDGRVCFSDWGAVQLWNDALQGPGEAGDSGGTVPDPGTAAITDEEALENHIENGARWQECRAKVKAIETIYRRYQSQE
jgi:hypothetical protein